MLRPPQEDQIQRIPLTTIRHLYNESQFPDMIAQGRLLPNYIRNGHLKEPGKVGEPYCTHSQFIRYLDINGQWVVEVHQYLRPDKTLGGKGKPDPKRLRIGNKVYIAEKQ